MMARPFEGQLDGKGRSFGIVVGRLNSLFGQQLLQGCLDALRRHGVDEDTVDVVWVPGAWEIPLTCQRLARSDRYDAIIALGAVVRGATPHFEHVATAVSRGLAEVGLAEGLPVINGVLTTDSLEQTMERAGTKAGNKGFDAAMGALEMANLLDRLPAEADA
jgi:6,7-dimethyl-8-ribityllumazine synthase